MGKGRAQASKRTKKAKSAANLPIDQVVESAMRGDLTVVVGSGVSMSLTNAKIPALSWTGLIRNGFEYGVRKGRIAKEQALAWESQLRSRDIDDLLCSAEFLGRKLDAPSGTLYARWLEGVFSSVTPTNAELVSALVALRSWRIPICTLNYDSLLEAATGTGAVDFRDIRNVTSWVRGEDSGILHLHGSWQAPPTCVLGIRDYATTVGSDVRDLVQRSLAVFRRLLFVGCGDTFGDPNFLALIKWLREKLGAASPEHYALVIDPDVDSRDADPAWQGFVVPIGYGKGHGDLAPFLLRHFPEAPKRSASRSFGTKQTAATDRSHLDLVGAYLSFLLRDCGQMTIEGMRTDLEIGQRKFDLERLFVPLKILPCEPDIPESDPLREEKLGRWIEKNRKPRPFGGVFSKRKRLALLALPGGGKTLLLKRIAVAYADSARRLASGDELPDLGVIPVLIRCREWRDHIQDPILAILKKLPEITGDDRLRGLSEALVPYFKKGKVLLLIDGLDEIHVDAHRKVFVDHLEAFLDEFKLTRLIVTSREAGFGLVAPSIARFCERWRVAPLEEEAIRALCEHWQRLMAGESPQALSEGRELASYLTSNPSLRRLAENPLLLTMLLVVKHGAGRLPPDRVSLYGRAVEILLDTWNIMGHDPLNLKEAVPQLAYIAFEMMVAGSQTATEKELLEILESAREKVPQIRRYAKDTPHAFLKRVELRSSLLVEAGHRVEAGQTVPFYQFRHLTFQEYLAAVAAAEGYYVSYEKSDSVLTPLEKYLTAEEWKEVVPMAAVLSRKQAEPLLAALVSEATQLRKSVEVGGKTPEARPGGRSVGVMLQPPVSRLMRCLIEEAEPAPETLTAALQLIVFFAEGCAPGEDWGTLARGPFGTELLHQAWLLYAPMNWPSRIGLLGSFARLDQLRSQASDWLKMGRSGELLGLLESKDPVENVHGLFVLAGAVWFGLEREAPRVRDEVIPHAGATARLILEGTPPVSLAASFTMAHVWHSAGTMHLSPELLDKLHQARSRGNRPELVQWSSYALAAAVGVDRGLWSPELTPEEILRIRANQGNSMGTGMPGNGRLHYLADLVLAFHSRIVWSEVDLARRLAQARGISVPRDSGAIRSGIDAMLSELQDAGSKYLKPRASRASEKKE